MLREPFAAGQSIIHHMDPRVRVLFASLYSIVIANVATPTFDSSLFAPL